MAKDYTVISRKIVEQIGGIDKRYSLYDPSPLCVKG